MEELAGPNERAPNAHASHHASGVAGVARAAVRPVVASTGTVEFITMSVLSSAGIAVRLRATFSARKTEQPNKGMHQTKRWV
jgi:hypothetical protein